MAKLQSQIIGLKLTEIPRKSKKIKWGNWSVVECRLRFDMQSLTNWFGCYTNTWCYHDVYLWQCMPQWTHLHFRYLYSLPINSVKKEKICMLYILYVTRIIDSNPSSLIWVGLLKIRTWILRDRAAILSLGGIRDNDLQFDLRRVMTMVLMQH